MEQKTVMFTDQEIKETVLRLAQEISIDHVHSDNVLPPVMICLLNGAIHFFSDLVRMMSIESEIDFMRLKSYVGQDNSGGISCTKELDLDLQGKRVYIVDDICDSGATIMEALFKVNSRQPADVRVVTLFKRKNGTSLSDFNGFEIDDEWIVGYGLDDNGLSRNVNYIFKIN